jgi:hypothetical protein
MTKLEDYERVVAYRNAAVADGWSIEPTYASDESVDSAARLKRDGFVMQILTRRKEQPSGKINYEADVAVWGPDRLCIRPGQVYSMEHLTAELRSCHYCGKKDVPTQQVAFCSRCCAECAPKQRAIQEQPGWCS